MTESPGGGRARVLEAVEARRQGVDRYLAEKRPVSSRLTYISITSSCLAAALTVGPAVGGETFAQTVQHGLNLGFPQTVWRTLCFVAVIVSVTAAIATNLSKSSDLASRIAAAETANGALDGLRMRLQVDLPVAEGAQQYQEIVARIPWIQIRDAPGSAADVEGRRPRPRLAVPYLLGSAAVGAIVVVVTIGGLLAGLANAAPSIPASRPEPSTIPSSGADPTTSVGAAAPASTAAPTVSTLYSGHTSDGVGIAVAMDNNKAIAYICDGNSLEAWLQGVVNGAQVTADGKNGNLTGTILDNGSRGSSLKVTAAIKGRQYQATINKSGAPAGVYEARIANPSIRIGWAVLKDGSQLGVENDQGIEVPAPALDLKDGNFRLNNRVYHATLRTSPDTVVVSQ